MSDEEMAGTVFLVWDGDYEQRYVAAVYSTRALAEAHLRRLGHKPSEHEYDIDEMELRSAEPNWRPYFHATGQVGETNAQPDIEPTVEERGITDGCLEDDRVGMCPGSGWMSGGRERDKAAVWLSVFGMDRDETLSRCKAKFVELRERRASEGRLPSWSDLIREEHANAS